MHNQQSHFVSVLDDSNEKEKLLKLLSGDDFEIDNISAFMVRQNKYCSVVTDDEGNPKKINGSDIVEDILKHYSEKGNIVEVAATLACDLTKLAAPEQNGMIVSRCVGMQKQTKQNLTHNESNVDAEHILFKIKHKVSNISLVVSLSTALFGDTKTLGCYLMKDQIDEDDIVSFSVSHNSNDDTIELNKDTEFSHHFKSEIPRILSICDYNYEIALKSGLEDNEETYH